MDAVDFSRLVFPILAILANVLTVAFLLRPRLFFSSQFQPVSFAALVAVTATLGSLFLSEVAGFIPCNLCWAQRIAMYPLAVILPLAAHKPARGGLTAAGVLAVGGLAISLWHYAIERIPALSEATSCSVSAPCDVKWIDAYGFVTIPYMAASGFILILVSLYTHKRLQSAASPATSETYSDTPNVDSAAPSE